MSPTSPPTAPSIADGEFVEALRAGSEAAFSALVKGEHPGLIRVARSYLRREALAEEAAQETWMAVIRGLSQFEGRSGLRTWIYSILANKARTIAVREGRTVFFEDAADFTASSSTDGFLDASHGPLEGHWVRPPGRWTATPEDLVLQEETAEVLRRAIADLPTNQRVVITMRDVEGWSAEETCNALGLSETNQRVLLHRARTRLRKALAEHLDDRGNP